MQKKLFYHYPSEVERQKEAKIAVQLLTNEAKDGKKICTDKLGVQNWELRVKSTLIKALGLGFAKSLRNILFGLVVFILNYYKV